MRVALRSLACVIATGLTLAGTQLAYAGSADFPVTNGHWYTQTNAEPGASLAGYLVEDDSLAPMWSEFQRQGGVAVLGYPVSTAFPLTTQPMQKIGPNAYFGSSSYFIAQAFQKAVLQWDPAK